MDLKALEAAVRAEVARERGVVAWLRSLPTPARLGLAVGFGALVAVATFAFAARGDLHVYPPARLALSLAWFGGAASLCAWLALRPLFLPPVGRGVLAAAAAFALAGPVVHALLPEVPTVEHLLRHGYRPGLNGGGCFAIGAVVSLLALLVARALDRGGGGMGRLVLAAAAAGLVGNLVLVLHCPINHAGHLLLGHATVPLALVLGLLVARAARR